MEFIWNLIIGIWDLIKSMGGLMIFESGIIFSTKLWQYKNLIHGISTKAYGNQSFLNSKFSEEETVKNREKFLSDIGIKLEKIVNVQLVHGNSIYDVKKSDAGRGARSRNSLIPQTDGLITNVPDIYLMVTVADCLPILFYEPTKKVVGIAHAGWRGTTERVTEKMIQKMAQDYGCKKEEIIVFCGPAIGPCHYEIQQDVASQFNKDFQAVRNEKTYLDLLGANKSQLLENGIKMENIEFSNECTACHPYLYSSYRMEGESKYIAMAAVIGLRK